MLQSYDHTKDWYIGRPSINHPIKLPNFHFKQVRQNRLIVCVYYLMLMQHDTMMPWFQRCRPTRGGTVRQQTTTENLDHIYPDSLLFVSAGFLSHFDHKSAAMTTRSYPTPAPSDGGRHASKSRAYCQVSMPCMCPTHH